MRWVGGFGRPASYDPLLDRIVRVQVSTLRSKAEENITPATEKMLPFLLIFRKGMSRASSDDPFTY
jgi:hypothetical protein